MQIMIDVTVESPEALDIAADFLKQHAALKRGLELPTGFNTDESEDAPSVPTGTPPAPPAPPTAEQIAAMQTLQAFTGKPPAPSNVVPFPPAPPAPVSTSPTPPVANSAGSGTGATAPVELDDSGMPWDARIHSKNKSKKQDGTWRLLKNVDKALLESVTQELHARMINSPAPVVEVPAPSFPGSSALPLPPAPPVVPGPAANTAAPAPAMPVPAVPAPGNVFGKSPLPAGVTPAPLPAASVSLPAAPPVPVPAAPALGLPDSSNAGMVPPAPAPEQMTEYRSFVAKAMQARNDGRLGADAVAQIVQQAGAPSIQLLGNMTHLVPKANFILDATLAGWTREQIAAHIAANGL